MQFKNKNAVSQFFIDNIIRNLSILPIALWCLDSIPTIRSALCWHVTTVLEQLTIIPILSGYAHTAGVCIAQCDPDRLCCVCALAWDVVVLLPSLEVCWRVWHYSVTWTYVIVPQCACLCGALEAQNSERLSRCTLCKVWVRVAIVSLVDKESQQMPSSLACIGTFTFEPIINLLL